MCIRDSQDAGRLHRPGQDPRTTGNIHPGRPPAPRIARPRACLLYTSDAADERSSVDLGGRRIIKKKKQTDIYVARG